MTTCPIASKLAQVSSKLWQILFEPFQNGQSFLMLCKTGEILPNLVTLFFYNNFVLCCSTCRRTFLTILLCRGLSDTRISSCSGFGVAAGAGEPFDRLCDGEEDREVSSGKTLKK